MTNYNDVQDLVRVALYSSSPMRRAEAAAGLTLLGLPTGPQALIIAAERFAAKARKANLDRARSKAGT